MLKIYKYFEIGYLIIAAVCIVEMVINFGTNKQKALIFMAFAVMAVFMYFFKRKFRKRFEQNNN
jgi:FtsH-binding integral membrane protein